jgi:multidrug efflux system membrane fusion protein
MPNVVVLPTAAVQRGPDGAYVYVIGADNKVAVRPVTVSQQDDKQAVIAQGVTAEEQVVTAGFARLKQGAEVQVSSPADKPAASTPQASAGGTASESEETASINGGATPAPDAASGSTGGHHKHGNGKHGHKRDAASGAGVAPSTPQ